MRLGLLDQLLRAVQHHSSPGRQVEDRVPAQRSQPSARRTSVASPKGKLRSMPRTSGPGPLDKGWKDTAQQRVPGHLLRCARRWR